MAHTLSPIIEDDDFNRIISIESRGDPNARPPKGSAWGLGQFLKGTWSDTGRKHYPALVRKFGAAWEDMRGGVRTATLQLMMLARFTEDNARGLGGNFTAGDLYLAHFLGLGDARTVLRADPGSLARDHVSALAIRNNPTIFTTTRTVQGLRSWAQQSMDTRWTQLKHADFVRKWYDPGQAAEYENGDATHEVDDGHRPPIKAEPVPLPRPRPAAAPDGTILHVQEALKDMNYPPGGLDGRWGGMTAGALTEFATDRHADFHPPTRLSEFDEISDRVVEEIDRARGEGWKRPVADARANADLNHVKEVAPEARPVDRNAKVGLWGSIATALVAAYDWISDRFSDAWNFFTDNQDKLPDDVKDPSWIWQKIQSVPNHVWMLLVAGVLLFVWLNSRSAVAKIVQDVKTGVRK